MPKMKQRRLRAITLLAAIEQNRKQYISINIIAYFWCINNVFVDCTVGENIIATIKMRNNFFLPFRNGLFSIAPHLVIALPTLR